jgi:hypothetical protein
MNEINAFASEMNDLNGFVSGAMWLACWLAGLFFLRFWRDTGDRLFALFAASFFLLGVTRIGLAISPKESDSSIYFYIARLLAFVLILVAVIDKNRR